MGFERTLTNLAAGRLSSSSTDAVNGSQLYASTPAIAALGTNADKLGTSTATNLGGGATYNPLTGTVSAPSYTIQGSAYNSVSSAFAAVDTTLSNIISGGVGLKYFHANSTLPNSNAAGTDSVAIGPASTATGANSVAMGNGATAGNAGGVALGSGSTTSLAVGTAGAKINGTYYAFAGTTPTSTVSVGALGSERTVTNVAAGQLSASSTDAVNGSQLYATNQAVTTLGASQNTLGTSVASALGGGSTYNPETGISVPSYTVYGSTQTSVYSAISALQTMSPDSIFGQSRQSHAADARQQCNPGWNWRPGVAAQRCRRCSSHRCS